MIAQSVIFGFLEEAGQAETGGRVELTLREVFEAYGGAGSGASRRLAGELGVSQRQVQRMVTEHGEQKRGIGPKSMRFFREVSRGEARRAGARFYRDNALCFETGSTFALCYHGDQEGDEREIRGDAVCIEDNSEWLDHFEAREYRDMERAFTDAFLEAYGVSAGDLDVCDEDEGSGLALAH